MLAHSFFDALLHRTVRAWVFKMVSANASKQGKFTEYWPSRVFEMTIFSFIILNCFLVIYTGADLQKDGQYDDDDGQSINVHTDGFLSIISCLVFTIEYLLRLWSCVESRKPKYHHWCTGRLRWAGKPLALLDLVCLIPFFLDMVLLIGSIK
jgi:hypothetical protein